MKDTHGRWYRFDGDPTAWRSPSRDITFHDRIHRRRGDAAPFSAREPCPRCDTTEASISVVGNQSTVRCGRCNRHLYNAPRTETGQRRRTVKTLRQGPTRRNRPESSIATVADAYSAPLPTTSPSGTC